MAQQLPDPVDLDHLLQAIRDGLLLHPAHAVAGSVKIVIESEAGEPLHEVKIDARRPPSNKPVLPLRHRPAPFAELMAATTSLQSDGVEQRDGQERRLLQRCNEQQQRITELEQQLRQVQQELQQNVRPLSPAAPLSPASSTDDDNSSSSVSSTSDSPHRSSGGETDDDDHRPCTSPVAIADGEDDPSPSSSSSSSTTVRKSERQKTNVDRWCPPAQHDASCPTAEPTSLYRKRKTKRRRRSRCGDDDEDCNIASGMKEMEVDSVDDDCSDQNDDTAEIAALVAKLREGYDRRQNITFDSLSKESILSLRQQVLDEAGELGASTISMQITSLITTSTSLKMVGYYLRATLARRLKATSQKCYKRLARDTLGIKSPADIAAYPALYELVLHHYPSLAAASIDVWLENPIFTADITWTEWKRYLTKQGRPIIDAALEQFQAASAPFQDWMQLGWVEIYDDERLGGQGVRALRDINMPTSKAKEAQRDVAASISVVAADLHCAGAEYVLDKHAAREADATYLVQLDRQRVFDARHHWIGKLNHLPNRLCNLKLNSSGKLVQIKPIAEGEALTFDYGADYWVYQLTGLELSDWLSSNSVQSNRGVVDLFNEMHSCVLDYTDLLGCDWVKRRPAASSELMREMWMGDLAEYLETRGLG